MSNGRVNDGPPPYTNEWYRDQLRLLKHRNERLHVEYLDQHATLTDLLARVALLEQQREADMAEIGRLNERLTEAGKIVRELRAKAVTP